MNLKILSCFHFPSFEQVVAYRQARNSENLVSFEKTPGHQICSIETWI